MTTEEKAKAYDEALKNAQYWLNAPQVIEDWNYTVKDIIPNIFPELHESEDERIRKAIMEVLKRVSGATDVLESEGTTFKKAMIWFEKQKAKERLDRMAPIYNDKELFESALEKAWKYYNESASRTVDSFEDDYIECVFSKGFREGFLYKEKQKEQKPNIELIQQSWYMEGYLDRKFCKEPKWILKTGEYGPKYELNPRYGEPLSTEQKSTEKQDYSDLTDLERAIHRGFLVVGVENIPVTIIKETAQDCLAQMKPAEWSKEDEEMRINILQEIANIKDVFPKINIQPEFDWLKSLPERFNLQPKQEWNEKDNIMFENIVLCLKEYCLTDEIKWLKSLSLNLKNKNEDIAKLCSNEWSEEEQQIIENAACTLISFSNIAETKEEEEELCELASKLQDLKPQHLLKTNKWRRYIWAINLRFNYDGLVRYEDNGSYEIVTAGNKPKRQVNGEYILLKDISSVDWKPSKEQMEALNEAIGDFRMEDTASCEKTADTLESLYNDLQKLL